VDSENYQIFQTLEKLAILQNDIFDYYNEEKISKKEMVKVLSWCQKMKEKLEKNRIY
jgi:hypothetical protein